MDFGLTSFVVSSAHAGGHGGGGGGGGYGGGYSNRGDDGGRGGGDGGGRGSSSGGDNGRGGSADTGGNSSNGGNGSNTASGGGTSANGGGDTGSKTSGDATSGDNRSGGGDQPQTGQNRPGLPAAASRGGGSHHGHGSDDPPQTIVEALKRVFTPPANPDVPAAPKQPVPRQVQPPSRPQAQSSVAAGDLYLKHEVLAVSLTDRAASRARALGFTVASAPAASVAGRSVWRLTTPAGTDARQARQLLHSEFPDGTFELNKVYRLDPTTPQSVAGPPRGTAPAGRIGAATPCIRDHCAGRDLIGWNQERLQRCGLGLKVAIIDTEIDQAHPAFEAVPLKFGTFIPFGRKAAPNVHATGVLALLAGHPASGTPGLAPHASYHVASIFYDDGNGGVASDTVSLLQALAWVASLDIKLVNMSFAGPKDALVQAEIEKLAHQGVVFVAAAGNDGPTAPPAYPAAYRPVIAVTAISKDMRSFIYANRGDQIDLAAPGVDVWTAVPNALEGYHTGTSFAAPFVTATLAAIIPASRSLRKDALLAHIATKDLGEAGRDKTYGLGMVLAPPGCHPEAIAKAPPADVSPPPVEAALPSPEAAGLFSTTVVKPGSLTASFR